MHVDKHVVKMILEYAQLLSTAHRILDGTQSIGFSETGRKKVRYVLPDHRESIMYSATHLNHPSAVWCRQSASNYMWLAELLEECCNEYSYRYGKTHKVESGGLMQVLKNNFPKNISNQPFTEPTPAMPDECKVSGDSITSYHNYYWMNKQHLASWQGKINKRESPMWWREKALDSLIEISQEIGAY